MIETRGLTKRYGPTLAVDDLSFTIQPGRVTGFVGPNGAGKSTTMRMILGLDRPTSGHALIDGRPYGDLDHPLRTVGALLDAKWVHPNRSARSHLRWLARSNRLPAGRVDEVLDQVGLTAVADRRAGTFSLGMSQRLGIAGALLGDPGILLFDEPVNGLDPEGIVWIRQLMRHLAGEGRSVLVSSHLLPEMALTATELVVIGRGRLITQSSTADFVDKAATSSVRVRSPQLLELAEVLMRQGIEVHAAPDGDQTLVVTGTDTAQVGELAAHAGVVLHELALHRGSLEEAFMHITGHDVEYAAGNQNALATTGR
ncbi:ABC-2 type transport system ATP-binding protein [Kibdelosporangium banguiense]|uniref:ABC-2 type transport system ATP-binding protein n=1 Tax=Kibdelosporangium banguiense TaxID=1365924 RepID=A0ABS4TKN4_9PSEU|nr:ATP-binding cassette domain-containing protein [Kibdelosporangium banguiense]MBP2324972.1 ABC-2 type transport system ATP-binding protein [Kibdelosporangium banguiense]